MRGNLYTPPFFPSQTSALRALVIAVLMLMPAIAFADVGEGAITRVIDWALALAVPAATLGVIFLGYRAWVGEISWRPVGMFVMGCVFIFGATAIAGYFTSGT